VLFAEAENRRLLEHIERLEAERGYTADTTPYGSLKKALAADASLAEAIARSGKVVLSMVFLMSADEARQLPAAETTRAFDEVRNQAIRVVRDSGNGTASFPMPEPAGLLVNVTEIRAQYTGHINSLPDFDGTLRWAPLVIRYHGQFFPSADVQAVRAFKRLDELVLHTTNYGITGLELGDQLIHTDKLGRALIHYHGPEQTIPTFSVADLLDGDVKSEFVNGKIVLVGATAKGIGDIRVTPYGPAYPGVEIRANTIQNLIDGDFINRPEWMALVDAVAIIALGAMLTWTLAQIGMWSGTALTLGLFVAYVTAAILLFRLEHMWLNIVYPSVLILALFVSSTVTKYVSAEAGKRQIKTAFQHVDEIIANVGGLQLGGEKRTLTVLFSDIRGFTSVSQSLPPEDLVRLLNVYLTQMTEKVFKYDGLLDKYIGDAIMAVYGAPIYRQDHALLACRTALDMLAELRRLQTHWEAQGLPALDIGIGINTGPMIVGNMGSRDRFDYTVIGDAVNLGSRIEGLNKIYGTHILLSEFTYDLVREEFAGVREIDVAQVRGRNEPVRIYELLSADDAESFNWLPEFGQAYALLRKQELAEAANIFERLCTSARDPVSHYHLQRCRARVSATGA
jgi:adenylate cyclase